MRHISRTFAAGALSLPLALGAAGVALAQPGEDNSIVEAQAQCEEQFGGDEGNSLLGLGIIDFLGGDENEFNAQCEREGFEEEGGSNFLGIF